MSRDEFILKLEEVSADIKNVPLNEIAVQLRRAAIRLRNLPPPENRRRNGESISAADG